MHRALALLLALLSLAAAPAAVADPADIAATARSVVRVVLIADEDGQPSLVGHGSGVAVAPDVILTNAHVVEAAREDGTIRIGVVPPQGKGGWLARVVAFAPKSDLALIKLTERGALPPATVFTGTVDDGSDVVAVGYPGNVDVAQGLNMSDIVSPTSPVKTRGSVSSGRSSKSFETILHTAPIGSGNSGGPLLDLCGRVIGINSFGTLSDEGDSEFYFAVSGREVLRFLRAAEISLRISGIACRSLAETDRAEAERLAGEKVHNEEEARAIAARKRDAAERAERTALFEVLAERDNRLALAMIALLLAFGAGGAAFVLHERARPREAQLAAAGAALLVVAALAAWLLRPGLAEVEDRAGQLAHGNKALPKREAQKGKGALLCTVDLSRSRITVSATSDIHFSWDGKGCANGNEQFAHDAAGWSRITLSDEEGSATVTSFDPDDGSYRAERYFLDLDAMTKLRGEQAKAPSATTCGGAEIARRQGDAQAALRALLPERPNERLVYSCR